jgi:HD-GYP domain-containing protein (c-di-GMP phosphodiesterase class II)
MRAEGWGIPAIVMAATYALFEWLRRSPYDIQYVAPHGHFYIVSAVALLATAVGAAVGIAGGRLRNIQVSFLSLAFISLAGVFTVHGLSTPGLLMHATQVSKISAQMSVILASFWLWMSTLPTDHFLVCALARWKNRLVTIWLVLLILFGSIGMLFPHLVEILPIDRNPLRAGVTILVFLLNGYTMYAYHRSYRYSRFPLQLAIVYSAGWFIVAQIIMVIGVVWHLSWWYYHIVLLASMIVMVAGLVKQYAAAGSILQALQALFSIDPIERVTNWMSPSVRALIMATESRDPYTAGHNFRVTMYALRLAEFMQVEPEQLRALAQGAIIHDVGKINIPDAILNKPGKLTDEERTVIEQHPAKGYDMCKNLGFMTEELGIIRSHHERWDGRGYPDQLQGSQIPELARIVAVADVYDALTSNRAYRKAWTHEDAMQLLAEGRGSHFDPQCIDAWVQLCATSPDVYGAIAAPPAGRSGFPPLGGSSSAGFI